MIAPRITEVKYKKLHPDAKINPPVHPGDVGYDMCSVESKWVFPLFPRKIQTGVAIESPEGYYCSIETRSGHGVKNHLRGHRGIIDNNYRGEVGVKMYNHGLMPYKVAKGEKIAQVLFHKMEVLPISEVFTLSDTARGTQGFGSTGK